MPHTVQTIAVPKVVFIFVNGIMTFPGASDNWNGRATSWALQRGRLAEKCEYFVGPISRMFGQWSRAKKLAKTMRFYYSRGFKMVLVGHSNGCDVIHKALVRSEWPEVMSLHLIAAASEADFQKTGYNEALRTNRIGEIHCYVGTRDKALWFASRSWLARGIGYGSLGQDGPRKLASDVESRVHEVRKPFSHSTWFDEEDGTFDRLMERITQAAL